MEQAILLGQYGKAIELITGFKDINNPDETILIEQMLKNHWDPSNAYEKTQLQKILFSCIETGKYNAAFLCAQLLDQQQLGYRILSTQSSKPLQMQLIESLNPSNGNADTVMKTNLLCLTNAYPSKVVHVFHRIL